eukprot:CAMPEP_0171342856 /NCGR_PEP_ID=MMETSP0878-20121228/15554_1 /TAXON_ID=67004 /ORGANISM="Thalassiosira weissflogii, Strain CCMP1336" /LENGTH=266 /DNA_ID=CAMNT_0011845643 /DNA_START=40 /DNA_END=837 /DNA_ORIENTATION=+
MTFSMSGLSGTGRENIALAAPSRSTSRLKNILTILAVSSILSLNITNISQQPWKVTVSPFGADSSQFVEDLMFKYKSDKSRDDHGYSKLYHMIFSPIRHKVKNITEVGISAGQSLQAWYRYFPTAEIHAFDIMWYGNDSKVSVEENLSFLKPRLHTHIVDILKVDDMTSLGFIPESMDIIIEDGPHSLQSQQEFLLKLFPFVKPGGYYIMEDVGYVQGGVTAFHEDPSKLRNDTRDILEHHDTIFVDTAAGHRAWETWAKLVGGLW